MTDSMPLGGRSPRPRVARGPRRPDYLGNPDLDRVMMMLTALMAEVSAARERIDTAERLAEAGLAATGDTIEDYDPNEAVLAERAATREAMLRRVYRVMLEELEPVADHRAEELS